MTGEDRTYSVAAGREAARDTVREARQARREAHESMREARATARERMREARASAREALREARMAARDLQVGARVARVGGDAEIDTRTRIQQVALELFTEHGYEATSLREIAEHLGVTKAALYYHFKTKDDIIASFVQDRMAKIEELIAWAQEQPRSLETRRELIRRYSDLLFEDGHHMLMRFFERNQSAMTEHKAGELMRSRIVQMLELLSERDAPLPDRIRSSLAIFALHSTWFVIRDPEVTDQQRRAAALEVALGLVERANALEVALGVDLGGSGGS